jgi:hypothetical protein
VRDAEFSVLDQQPLKTVSQCPLPFIVTSSGSVTDHLLEAGFPTLEEYYEKI